MYSQRSREPEAIDRWMRLRLAQQYAEVLREPVPEALLKLLRDTDS